MNKEQYSEKSFIRWWKQTEHPWRNTDFATREAARSAWNHQQTKIDELQNEIREMKKGRE